MSRAARCADLRSREAGFTLPEVLVALIFLGTVIAAVILTMGSSIMASDYHRKTVTADSVVRTYAERLQAVGYVSCATTATPAYQPGSMFSGGQYAGFAAGTHPVSVKYWNGDSPATFSPTCATDRGIQLITISAVSSDNRGHQTLDVIKRQPS
jgi:type II secretory pathway pseudopilin PulG